MVSSSIFKDAMLQAVVVLCYCRYQNGVKKDQWRTARTSVFDICTWQCGASKRCHVMKSTQVSLAASCHTSLKWMQCSPIRHKDLHYHPYKFQVAQELSEWDKVILLQFCNEFLDLVKNESNIVNTLLMSSDAHFRLWINRIVVTGLQTTHMNFTIVLCIVQKYNVVWSLYSWHHWSLFLWECKGSYSTCECRAVQSHAGKISAHWAPRQQVLLCFQQDGITTHTAEISMQVLRTLFLGRLISRFGDITFPACWPDHGVPDYFLWGYVKSSSFAVMPSFLVNELDVSSLPMMGIHSHRPVLYQIGFPTF